MPAAMIWFSPRERSVLTLLCECSSNKQMAAELQISVHTVRWHVSELLRKLDLCDRTELVVWCLQNPDDVNRGYTHTTGLHASDCACDSGGCSARRRMMGKAA